MSRLVPEALRSFLQQRGIQHACAFAALFLALVVFTWPVVFSGHVLLPPASIYQTGYRYADELREDSLEEIFAWRAMVHDRLRRGDVPLWNPATGGGAPMLANNQSAVFSPTGLLFLGVPSPARALTFSAMLLLLMGGLAAYGFLRIHHVGFAAACTSPMVNREHPLVQGGLIAAMILVHDLIRFLVLSGASLSRALPLWVSISPGSAAYSGLLIPLAVAILPQILVRGDRRAVS